MVDGRAETILKILRSTFNMPAWTNTTRDPFATLIVTIISQNTNDKNTARAFENLSKKFRIAPETLAEAEMKQVENCLKVGGLYRNKAKAIRRVSNVILKKYNGNIGQILLKPLNEARNELLRLPGVGPKTADVVLLLSARKPTLPVDTHVYRVSKRLGLAPTDADYETVRGALQSVYDPEDYLAVHILLISHGRKYCKAKAPLCKECPLAELCPSRYLWS
jgi:endonuclease-3